MVEAVLFRNNISELDHNRASEKPESSILVTSVT